MTDRGIVVLQDCEGRLRELVSEAAASGEYELVLRLTEWARTISALASGSPLPGREDAVHAIEGNGADAVGRKRSVGGTNRRNKGTRKVQRKKRPLRAAYPRFARLKNELVKIGWSKKQKKEYQHKAPRHVVDSLADRLVEVAATEDLFSSEQLFPLADQSGQSEIPSYQAYLCLAWFRDQNLVEQVGRQGYRLTDCAGLKDVVDQCWQNLPKNS